MKNITVYQVAQKMKVKDRKVLSLAGGIVIATLRKMDMEAAIETHLRAETWYNREYRFWVATYPPEMEGPIKLAIIKAQKHYGNKTETRAKRHRREKPA